PVPLVTGEVDELLRSSNNGAPFWRTRNGDAAAPPEFEQALVSQHPQRPQHGVRVNAENGGEVLGGREALSRLRLALRDRSPDPTGHLLVEVSRVGLVHLDIQHSASHSSLTVSGRHA